MNTNLVVVKNLQKWFPRKGGLRNFLQERPVVKAVDGISFTIKRGEIFGLIGESGSGKTTTGKMIMRLLEPSAGELYFDNQEVAHIQGEKLKEYRKSVQMIFQDPYTSMNPHFRIRQVLEEPLKIHKIGSNSQEREQKIREVLDLVKISPPEEFLCRHPHMLSGGQRQRIATARGLILQPRMMVADEPVSMVDLSTRAEILHMMKEVQRSQGLTYLYITHDLSTARYFTDKLAVMYLGRIVEMGTPDQVVDNPLHPYTKALLHAVCEPEPGKARTIKTLPITGEIPSSIHIPSGCRFHPRCIYAIPECSREAEPELLEVEEGHSQACSRWKEVAAF